MAIWSGKREPRRSAISNEKDVVLKYSQASVAPQEGIQDTLCFWIPRRGFRIPGTAWVPDLCQWNLGSEFQSLVGFWIHWAVFRTPKQWFRIPQVWISSIPDSSTLVLGSLNLFTVAFKGLHHHSDCLIPKRTLYLPLLLLTIDLFCFSITKTPSTIH